MTDLIVYKPDGSHRVTITVDERTYCEKSLMDKDRISCSVTTTQYQGDLSQIIVGDYIIFKNEKYYLNRPSQIERLSSNKVKYTFSFEGEIYRLLDKTFRQPVTGNSEFILIDTLEGILDVLLMNINSEFPGWTKGSIIATERKTVSFDKESCYDVLNKLANEFSVEYYLSGKEFSFVKKLETPTIHVFSVGKELGLYELKRLNVDGKSTITRAYLYGGTKNIPSDYRSGSKRLVYEALNGNRFIEDYSHFAHLVEGNVVFEDVYPRFTGVVSSVTQEDGVNKKISFAIDFDIKDHLVSGVTAKLVFKTGDLTGKEFEIEDSTYDSQSQNGTITLIPYSDNVGVSYPNATFYPKQGDEFTLVDMDMPQNYVDNAEAELLIKGQEWLSIYSQLRVKYELKFDSRYLRENNISFKIGDKLQIIDNNIGVNQQIRIVSLKINVDNPYDVTAEISNILKESWEDEITKNIQATSNKVNIQESSSVFDINATKDWVARNFVYINKENHFGYLQHFTAGINASDILLSDTGYADIILENIQGKLTVNNFEVWHAGNDGPGGGMNADLLDNYHASSFPRKNENATILNPWIFNNTLTIDFAEGVTAIGDLTIFDNFAMALIIDSNDGIVGVRQMEDQLWKFRVIDSYTEVFNQLVAYEFIKGDGIFIDGFAGSNWQLNPNDGGYSHLTVDMLTVRRGAKFYELEIDEVTHIGGSIMLSAGHGVVSRVSGSNLYFDTDNGRNPIQFKVSDRVMAQTYSGRDTGYFLGIVTAVSQVLGYITVSTIYGATYKGMKLVQCGNPTDTTRQSMIYMTTVESSSPYISFLTGITDGTFTNKEVVHIGDLSPINHTYWGQLSGNGIVVNRGYFNDVDIRGRITVTGGNAATQTYASNVASNAQTAANLYTDQLETALGSLAWEDIIEAADLGTTIIQGGHILTSLLDVNAIRVAGSLVTTSQAQTYANTAQSNAQNYTDTLKNSLGNLAYSSLVNTAQLGTTIISGGYILTSLIDANSLRISGGYETTTGAQAKANTAQTNAQSAAQTYANTAQSNAENSAQSYADTALTNAQSYTDSLENSLGNLAFESLVEEAMLGTTLIQGGYILTSLLDANAIKANIINTNYIEGLTLDFDKGTIGGWEIGITYIQSVSGSIRLDTNQDTIYVNSPDIFVNVGQIWEGEDYIGNYGLSVYNWNAGNHMLKINGNSGLIAGWNFDVNKIYNPLDSLRLIANDDGAGALQFIQDTTASSQLGSIKFLKETSGVESTVAKITGGYASLGKYDMFKITMNNAYFEMRDWSILINKDTSTYISIGNVLPESPQITAYGGLQVVGGDFKMEGYVFKVGTFSSSSDSTQTFTVSQLTTLAGIVVSVGGTVLSLSGNTFTFNRDDGVSGTVTGYYIAWGS